MTRRRASDLDDFYIEFGTWEKALEAAGIDGRKALSDDIERVAEKLGRVPTSSDMDEHGAYSISSYWSYFDSWSAPLDRSSLGDNREEKMTETLQSLDDRLDQFPKASELPEECEYSPNDFYNEFGSWEKALEAAGIDKEQALLEDIERVAEKLEDAPTTADLNEHGIYSSSYYLSHFESLDTALEQAGVKQKFGKKSEMPDRTKLLNTLKSLYSRLGRAPKATELPEDCEYSQYDFYNEFGSWDEALEAAGIDREQSMLKEIERVAEKLGRAPGSADMGEHGAYSSGGYSKYFDSWSEALKQADVEQTGDSGSSSDDREAMLEVIRELNERVGRAPKATELPEECEFSPNDFYNEFGSWDEALEAAGIDKEQDMLDEIERVAKKTGRVPNTVDMQEHGAYSSYSSYFGSWDAALEAADLSVINPATVDERKTGGESSGAAALDPGATIRAIIPHVDGLGSKSINRLNNAGYTTVSDLRNVEPSKLTKYKGIGQAKATKMIRFANESSSTQGARQNQTRPSALDSSWETIPDNERIDEPFLLEVTGVAQRAGGRKTARLDVRDQNGRKFEMDIWTKHDIDQDWREGGWYVLENTRGKVWESNDGTTRKQLSSTKDLKVSECSPGFDPNAASAADTMEAVSNPEETGANTSEGVSGSTDGSANSSRDAASTVDDEEDDGDNGSEVDDDGVLDDIMSEFDEI